MTPIKIINSVTIWTVVVPCVVGFINRFFLNKSERIIYALMLVGFITEITNNLITDNQRAIGWALVIYTIIEILLLLYFYASFFNSKKFKIIAAVVYSLFLFFVVWDALFNSFANIGYFDALELFFVLPCSFYFLFYIMENNITEDLLNEPFFWINTGILFYFSGNLCLFVLNKIIPRDAIEFLWMLIHNSMNLVLNLSIAIGLWKTRKRISL